MDRQIVCFKVPAFEIALARLTDASLRDRPVAIAPPHTSRALLLAVSSEAAEEGLAVGMPIAQARRFCPTLRFLSPDPVLVRQAQNRLIERTARFAPAWEPVGPGHLFLDLTGTTRLFGRAIDTAARIEREVAQRDGLLGVIGVASNKLVSRMAAKLVPPRQLYEVRPGSEEPFLAPLPVTALPGLGQSPKPTLLALLEDLNIQTLGELAEIHPAHLELVLGREAARLSNWAHGIDPSPVVAPAARSRLDAFITLAPDEIDDARLSALLDNLLEHLCRELRQRRQGCRRLTLTARYSDDQLVTGARSLGPLAEPTCWEADLRPHLQTLFRRHVTRRVRIRRLTVGVEDVTALTEQLSLFSSESFGDSRPTRARRLATALDRITARFGEHALRRGGHSDLLSTQVLDGTDAR